MAEPREFKAEYLSLSATPEAGVLTVSPACELAASPLTVDSVCQTLVGFGIRHGLNREAVAAIFAAKDYNREIVVARATPPDHGRDARVVEKVLTDKEAKPIILGDGSADYKNLGTIIQVQEGQFIAERESATLGTAGQDIFGNSIASQPGKEVRIPNGPGTTLSADGNRLTAAHSGYLYRKAGLFCVGKDYILEGDVNFKSGNIDFLGDVHIKGSVTEGFSVTAGGHIIVEAECDGAHLKSRKGNIVVNGGFFGKGTGSIEAPEGKVSVTLAQDLSIRCRALEVSKALLHSQVETFALKATTKEALVAGGKIVVYGSALLQDVGMEGSRTEIHILDEQEESFRRELASLEKKEEPVKTEMEGLEKRLRGVQALMKKYGTGVPPRIASEIKQVGEDYKRLRKQLLNVQSEMQMIRTDLEKPRANDFVFRIRGKMIWGVHLDMFHVPQILTLSDSGREYRMVEKTLESFPCSAEE